MNVRLGHSVKIFAPLSALALLAAACGGGAAPATPAAATTAPKTAATTAPAAASPAAKTAASPAAKTAASPAAKTAASPAASPAAATRSTPPKQNLGKITIAQPSNSLSFSPIVIAEQLGYFKEEGLEAELVLAGSGSKTAAAVIGGSANIGSSALGDLIGAVAQGQDVKVFGVFTVGSTTGIVVRQSVADEKGVTPQSPIEQRVQALKGLKLAISTPGSGTDTTLRYVLQKYGVDPERDVEILTTGAVVNSMAAYAQGSADGASLSSPSTETAVVEHGAVNLINTALPNEVPGLSEQANTGFWATGEWLEQNPEQATAALIAIWRAIDYINQNPEQARELVHKAAWEQTDPQVFELAWDSTLTPTLVDSPEVRAENIQSVIDYYEETEGTQVDLTADQASTNVIYQRAKQELGR